MLEHTTMVANIRKYWEMASVDDREAGATWYHDAHVIARRLAAGDVVKGAGVIAALSPITPWNRNLALAARTFEEQGLTGGTLGTSVRAANRIFSGEHPLDVLKGEKVRNFFLCISDPFGEIDAVCVDRHAFSVASGKYVDDAGRAVLARKGSYAAVADAYREIAREARTTAHAIQATTWLVFRRVERGIVD